MSLASEDFGVVRKLVLDRSAIALSDEQSYLVESRLLPVARQVGCDSLATLVGRLQREPFGALHQRVVEAMTTNETSFFRDRHPFDALRESILAEVVMSRASERRLRIWSAAASSGQEAYSLAMLLWEACPVIRTWDIKIVGTDISSAMVAKAQSGRYSQLEVGRGLPSSYLVRYFDRQGTDWQIKEPLRRMVDFRVLNLTRPDPSLTDFDIVFLRNVLIYFTPATRVQVLAHTARALRSDGYLFLGATESLLGSPAEFVTLPIGKAIAHRHKKGARNA
jgi:chemotaxis protein methyltransferase CheR